MHIVCVYSCIFQNKEYKTLVQIAKYLYLAISSSEKSILINGQLFLH